MPFGAIGAFLVVLLLVFVVGNLWFHLVEGVLERIKGLFRGRKEPQAWHPLPPEQEEDSDP